MTSGAPAAILSLRGLSKAYGGNLAVDDLSLDVRRGEVLGFLGPNGAGKTTTINMICGLVRPDAGAILLDGLAVADHLPACRRRLGLCPQDVVVWESLTCLEQLEFTARLYDVPRRPARQRALHLLEILGLGERRGSLAGTLSGGMKRRLNIALALVHEPEVLILDEPQAGLDPQSRILVREHIRSLATRVTVVVTTHDMDEADRLSDRIAIIDHGRLLVLDSAARLKADVGEGDVLEITVGATPAGRLASLLEGLPEGVRALPPADTTVRLVGAELLRRLAELLDHCRRHDVAVEDVRVRPRTLEDVFIALTGRGLRE